MNIKSISARNHSRWILVIRFLQLPIHVLMLKMRLVVSYAKKQKIWSIAIFVVTRLVRIAFTKNVNSRSINPRKLMKSLLKLVKSAKFVIVNLSWKVLLRNTQQLLINKMRILKMTASNSLWSKLMVRRKTNSLSWSKLKLKGFLTKSLGLVMNSMFLSTKIKQSWCI